jgi:hypothetical protein
MGKLNNKGMTGSNNQEVGFVGNILSTNVTVTASAVTCNLTNEHIEEFILDKLLPAQNVDTSGMSVMVVSEFVANLKTNILIPILLLDSTSKEILRNTSFDDDFAIPINNKNKVKLSENLKRALSSVTDESIPYQTVKQNKEKYVFITLSMNEILKDMLNADGIQYVIGINNVRKSKGDGKGQRGLISFKATKMLATRKNKKKGIGLSNSSIEEVAARIANFVSARGRR